MIQKQCKMTGSNPLHITTHCNTLQFLENYTGTYQPHQPRTGHVTASLPLPTFECLQAPPTFTSLDVADPTALNDRIVVTFTLNEARINAERFWTIQTLLINNIQKYPTHFKTPHSQCSVF